MTLIFCLFLLNLENPSQVRYPAPVTVFFSFRSTARGPPPSQPPFLLLSYAAQECGYCWLRPCLVPSPLPFSPCFFQARRSFKVTFSESNKDNGRCRGVRSPKSRCIPPSRKLAFQDGTNRVCLFLENIPVTSWASIGKCPRPFSNILHA